MTDLLTQLLGAQARAQQLFSAIADRKIVREGASEASISEAIFTLAASEFGTDRHWHRRVVRAGPNTRLPFSALPEDRTVQANDIVSVDLGPVFGEHEADFGRTFVVGDDPAMLRLRDDLQILFVSCRDFYRARPEMPGAELYAHVVEACAERGWGFGGAHAGHLVGTFPIAHADRNAAPNRIRPDNQCPMNAPRPDGTPRHWILEIHLLDPSGQYGGFFEELLLLSE